MQSSLLWLRGLAEVRRIAALRETCLAFTVDGKYVGNTPTTLHLSVGDHLIRLEKPGFKPWERTLTTTGESTTITPTLEKNE